MYALFTFVLLFWIASGYSFVKDFEWHEILWPVPLTFPLAPPSGQTSHCQLLHWSEEQLHHQFVLHLHTVLWMSFCPGSFHFSDLFTVYNTNNKIQRECLELLWRFIDHKQVELISSLKPKSNWNWNIISSSTQTLKLTISAGLDERGLQRTVRER